VNGAVVPRKIEGGGFAHIDAEALASVAALIGVMWASWDARETET